MLFQIYLFPIFSDENGWMDSDQNFCTAICVGKKNIFVLELNELGRERKRERACGERERQREK